MGVASPVVLSHPMRVALLGAELVANRLRARPHQRADPAHRPHPPRHVRRAARARSGRQPGDRASDALPAGRVPRPGRDRRAQLPRLSRAGAAWHPLQHRQRDRRNGCRPRIRVRPPPSAARPSADRPRGPRPWARRTCRVRRAGFERHGGGAAGSPQRDHACGRRRRLRRSGEGASRGADGGAPNSGEARELLMLVSGPAKATALRDMLERERSPASPASLLRAHPRLTLICDTAAAGLLQARKGWSSDRALIVLGHREPSISPEHRISDESRARLQRAERECRRDPPRAVILTGYSKTGGLSEAEQMEAEWSLPDVPVLLEDAGRDTAENASRSLPIIRGIGAIRRVTVVTSAWHLRAPYFFAPYRRFGLRLSFRLTAHGSWPRMLWHELRNLSAMRRNRRRAMAEMRLPPEVLLPSLEERERVGGTS